MVPAESEPAPAGGLRERKKAEMRQRISDIATGMFLERGFEAVRVADIAAAADVSEKTVFNYFPTKESLVFDQADAQLAEILRAVSERAPGVTPTYAYISEVVDQLRRDFDASLAELREIGPRFTALIEETPALRAAWGDHRHHMVIALAGVLAGDLGIEATEPEMMSGARALVSLTELSFDSLKRHVGDAASREDLLARVQADLERGARLLDTGLWSLPLVIGGRRTAEQLREAKAAADTARKEVMAALQTARRAWHRAQADARQEGRAAARDSREAAREIRDAARDFRDATRGRPGRRRPPPPPGLRPPPP